MAGFLQGKNRRIEIVETQFASSVTMVRFRLRKRKEIQETRLDDTTAEGTVSMEGEYYKTLATHEHQVSDGRMVVPEYGLSQDEKTAIEKNITAEGQRDLAEKNWEKTAKEDLDEIRTLIDQDVMKKPVKKIEKKEEIPPPTPIKDDEVHPPPEPIKGSVIDREIIYETPGGYVVKVTYREDDKIDSTYYSISKIHDVEHALDNIRDYKPTFTPKTPLVKEEEKKDGFLKKTMEKLGG